MYDEPYDAAAIAIIAGAIGIVAAFFGVGMLANLAFHLLVS